MAGKGGYYLRSNKEEYLQAVPREEAILNSRTSTRGITSMSQISSVKSVGSSTGSRTEMSVRLRKNAVEMLANEHLLELEQEEEELETDLTLAEMTYHDHVNKLEELQKSLEDLPLFDEETRRKKTELIEALKQVMEEEVADIKRKNFLKASKLKIINRKRDSILKRKSFEESVIEEELEQNISDEEVNMGREVASVERLLLDDEERRRQEELDRQFALKLEALEFAKVKAEEDKKRLKEMEEEVESLKKVGPSVLTPVSVPPLIESSTSAEQFAMAIVKAIGTCGGGSQQPENNKFLARQAYGKELPKFSGNAEDWPIFFADFERSTKDCGYSNSDNVGRLRKCLEGDAKKYVSCLMVSPDNVPQIIEDLKERYGQPEHIIRAMIDKAKGVPSVESEKLESLVEFGSAVRNFTATVKTLNRSDHLSNPQLQHELECKLPDSLRMIWMGWVMDDPSRKRDLDHFSKWLSRQTSIACQICPPPTQKEDKKFEKKIIDPGGKRRVRFGNQEEIPTIAELFVGQKKNPCIFCDKHTDSSICFVAEKMPLEDKRRIIRDKRCCYRCLKPGHNSKFCKTEVKCKFCQMNHVSSMCYGLPSNKKPDVPEEGLIPEQGGASAPSLTMHLGRSSPVILKTMMVTIEGRHGRKQVRAFLDDGAQSSYILKKTATDLDLLPCGSEEITHTVFGGLRSVPTRHNKYQVRVQHEKGSMCSILNMRDQIKICDDLPRVPRGQWMRELKQHGIWLTDVGDGSHEIEMLLGADVLPRLYTAASRVYLQNGLMAVHTVLGWTLMGPTVDGDFNVSRSSTLHVTTMAVMEPSVEQFWALEAIGITDSIEAKSKKEKEEEATKHFLETVKRTEEGRYSVSLPWIEQRPQIPTNRNIAEKRLESATCKLLKQNEFHSYDKIIKGWEVENFIEEVPEGEVSNICHYLPHRPVFKPESATTPVRPVFDASCHALRTPSLNDCLEKGPNLIELIPSVLLKFREKKIGITSDIRKAFQMIEVAEEDRDFLRFLWYTDESMKIKKIYRHRRVVFGVNCSPFLLAAVLEHFLTNYGKSEDEKKARKFLKSLYVDNCVTSVDTIEEGVEFMKWAISTLLAVKMDIRQWEAGCGQNSGIGSLECGLDFGLDGKPVTSVLGYKWNKVEDTLKCDITVEDLPEIVNKRMVLSFIQKVYDPIGFTCPATLTPKLLIQKLWATKLTWDEDLPQEYKEEFLTWGKELKYFNDIKILRNITGGNSSRESWQIHTFCDASKLAYGTVVFLRTSKGPEVSVQLLAAKARVAPMKKATINRLELMSCLIGSNLTAAVTEGLTLENVRIFYWTDSSTALAWITGNDDWGTFVGNRVKSICAISDEKAWRHVPGCLNPADLPSRGCTPSQLSASKWWEGPTWLYAPEEEWPCESPLPKEDLVLAEKRKSQVKVIDMIVTDEVNPWYMRKSKFEKNVRIMGWVLRFIETVKKKCSRKEKVLSVEEIIEAETVIMKIVQLESIPLDQPVISGLKTELQDGFVRVKGKMGVIFDDVEMCFRRPILLPHIHPIVDQLIYSVHVKNEHAGIQFVLTKIREKYWIVRGRKSVRRVIQQCVKCRRYSVKKSSVVPAPLPEDRVKTGKPFEVIGVDLAGPLLVRKNQKVWIVLYTCAVYRCVHLEMVRTLTTDEFLEAFTRFVNRRGRPAIVYSDNGTNFVGAYNALRELDWVKIEEKHGMEMIEWKFNPPASPWWGGFWERLVRSVKDLLRKSLGKSKLSFEKLYTVVTSVEAIVNGRPLTTVTEDPEDFRPLTPAMFMHDLPAPNISDQELLAKDFQGIMTERDRTIEQLRDRFRKEYLALLVHRGKEQKVRQFQVGEIVLIGSDDKKRILWPMAKIVELISGKDGHVRVAKLKTAKGELTRPIQWLFPLEVSSPKELPEQMNKDDEVTMGKKTSEESVAEKEARMKTKMSEEKVLEKAFHTRAGRKCIAPERFGLVK